MFNSSPDLISTLIKVIITLGAISIAICSFLYQLYSNNYKDFLAHRKQLTDDEKLIFCSTLRRYRCALISNGAASILDLVMPLIIIPLYFFKILSSDHAILCLIMSITLGVGLLIAPIQIYFADRPDC